jgi:hypothetical protein
MRLKIKKTHILAIIILFAVAFACIAPSIDWYGTPQLKGLATKSANDFYTAVYAEKYDEVYEQANEELRKTVAQEVFRGNLKAIKLKLKDGLDIQQTQCIWTRADSFWDRIRINSGSPVVIKATCVAHSKESSFSGKFKWRYQGGVFQLISLTENNMFD